MSKKFYTQEQWIEKAQRAHAEDNYDYSQANYLSSKEKVTILCPLHGPFQQNAREHIKGDRCPLCTKRSPITFSEFKQRSALKHLNKYFYKEEELQNLWQKVSIRCPKHGWFKQIATIHVRGRGCPLCRESHAEKEISRHLMNLGISFERQKSFPSCRNSNPLRFDFYIAEKNLAIEYNGLQHYKPIPIWGGVTEFQNQQIRDEIKRTWCAQNGIKLLEIPYNVRDLYSALIEGLNKEVAYAQQ